MNHLSENDFVLLYYADGDQYKLRELETHIAACGECRREFERTRSMLGSIDMAVPEPAEDYGRDVWHKLQPFLPNQTRSKWFGWLTGTPKWAPAIAVAAMMVAAFGIGRWFERSVEQTRPNTTQQSQSGRSSQIDARERLLLIEVGAHLERAQIVLSELANAKPAHMIDITSEQEAARALLPDNRLYRETATQLADVQIARLLDELERLLVDLSHRESMLSTDELNDIREQIDTQGILFKVRIAGSELRQRNAGL